ncbi:MAG: JDVT-CTERM domain-containing protein [Candidatus Manganitrophus sp. SA1]|nr:JDVT-CTERM domain-containing protein [Candidatus Manganitrophus morganii]
MIHKNLRYTFLSLFLSLILSPLTFTEKAEAAAQITTNANDEGWSLRNSAASRGNVLWYDDQTESVFLNDNATPVQAEDPNNSPGAIESTVFSLGSGSSPGQVIGAWRRGQNDAWVWISGGTPSKVVATNPFGTGGMNPEGVAIADGCVFMVLQAGSGQNTLVKHVFRVDPATNIATLLTGGIPLTHVNGATIGAARISTSDCQAAWVFDDGSEAYHLQFYNGTSVTTVATGDDNTFNSTLRGFHLNRGRLVYEKLVNGIRQIFLYDSTASNPAAVQLTTETDASLGNFSPRTDGRHIAWLHGNANGTDVHIIFNGGVQLTDMTNRPADLGITTEHPFQLHRGQLFWTDLGGSFRYHDGSGITTIDPAPSTSVVTQLGSPCCLPWLADGFVHWIGLSNDGGLDSEVFRFTGTAPADTQQPVPPLLVTLAPGANQITINWDQILGADSYNLYISEQSGLTKENFATLRGGRKRSGVTGPYTLTGLTPNRTYHFVITAVDGGTEGSGSRKVATALINWASVGGLSGTNLFAVAADKTTDGTAYAAGGSNVYKTTDGGNNWTALAGGINGKDVRALAVDGANVYAASRDIFNVTVAKISKSTNGGGSWIEPVPDGGTPGQTVQSLAIDPTHPSNIYAGNFDLPSMAATDSLLIKSTNEGTNWAHLPNPIVIGADLRAYAIVFDAAGVVYAGGSGTPNVAKSSDGGATWTDIRILGGGVFVYSLAIDPTNTSILYAGTLTHGIYKSVDGGVSWTKKNTGLPELPPAVRALLIDPADPKYIHAGTSEGYYYTLDGGETWTAGNNGSLTSSETVYGLALTPSRNLIAATSNGLFLLDLSAEPTTAVVSDLALSSTVTPNSVSAGENLAYQITVTNQGPDAATSAVITMILTAGTSLVSAEPQGACQGTDTVTCNLGVIDNGANAVVTILITPSVAGDLNQQAQVSTGSTDPNGANNSVLMSATVSGSLQGGNGGGAGDPGGDNGNDGVSTGGSGGGGGGGCTMKIGGEVDPTLIMLLGLILIHLGWRRKLWVLTLFLSLAAPNFADANNGDLGLFNTKYGTASTGLSSCTLCHGNASTSSITAVRPLTSYGADYLAQGRGNSTSFGTIEPKDSDGDGFSNLTEIEARTFPGNANSKPTLNVGLVPTADTRFDNPGATISYKLTVTNAGNTTDSYTITVTGNAWTTTPSGSVGPVAASGTADFTVTVAIPADATEGDSDAATIKVTSQSASTQSATAIVTTTAFSTLSFGDWSSVGGVSGTTFHAVAADQTNDGIAYAAGGSNVYKTTDGGSNWTVLAGGISGKDVRALAVEGLTVYASSRDIFGVTPAKILKSVNGGGSWAEVLSDGGSPGEQNKSLVIDPIDSNTVYAGNFQIPSVYNAGPDSLVIKSANKGANWSHLPNSTAVGAALGAYAIAIDSARVIYAGGSGTPNLAKSTNGGSTWSDIPIAGVSVFVYSLTIDPTNPQTIYAGTRDQGVFKSTDGGTVFSPVNTGLPAILPTIYALLIHPDEHDQIFAATSAGLYFSPDGGDHWVARSSGLTALAQSIRALAVTPSLILIGATEDGLFILDLSSPTTGTGGSGGTGGSTGGGVISPVGPGGTSGGGGGGGCALGGDGAADALLPGLFCFALAALVWRKCFLKDKKDGAPGRNRTYSQ